MKFLVVLVVIFGLGLHADRVKKTSTVCTSLESVVQLVEYTKVHPVSEDALGMELWLMNHECKIIDSKTEIEVLDYTGKKQEILKMRLKKTGEVVFGLSKGIQIEQPGQKNVIYKF